MTGEMIFVAVIIVLMLIGLSFEVIRADFLIFIVLVIFLITGVISSEQALSGFSNEGMLTVLLLFIVAGAIQKHGIIELVVYRLLGKGQSVKKSMVKVMLPVGLASGFLNNTPIVVALTPIIRDWAIDNGWRDDYNDWYVYDAGRSRSFTQCWSRRILIFHPGGGGSADYSSRTDLPSDSGL